MNHLSLFSGIGGADLAASWAGIETVAVSEIDQFCCQVLEKNFPKVPNLGDIHNVTKEAFHAATELDTVDIISGGFPCQPWSVAGQQRGKDDDRHLWPEMLRVIKELRPTWVVGENVAGFIHLGLDQTLSDLASEGYEPRTFVLPAASVGAWHCRYRVFVIANIGSVRLKKDKTGSSRREQTLSMPTICGTQWSSEKWLSEPAVGRMVYGTPSRMDRDRIKAMGNMIVPQQIYPIFKAIADVERAQS